MNCYRTNPPEVKIPSYLENIDWVCNECHQDMDPLNEKFIILDSNELSPTQHIKEVMYHPECAENPDEPNIFVEHKL